jgi:hypothetical protein
MERELTDAELDEYFKKVDKLKEKYKIRYCNWSDDIPKSFTKKVFKNIKTIEFSPYSSYTFNKQMDLSNLDVWVLCDSYISINGDYDHSFLESIEVNGDVCSVFLGS